MLTQVNQTFFRQLVTGGLPCTISSGRLSLTWTSKRHLSLSRQMTKVPVTPLFPAKFSLSFPAGSSSRFQTCKFDPEEMSSSRPGTVQNWISSEWKRIWEKLVTTMERESIIIRIWGSCGLFYRTFPDFQDQLGPFPGAGHELDLISALLIGEGFIQKGISLFQKRVDYLDLSGLYLQKKNRKNSLKFYRNCTRVCNFPMKFYNREIARSGISGNREKFIYSFGTLIFVP